MGLSVPQRRRWGAGRSLRQNSQLQALLQAAQASRASRSRRFRGVGRLPGPIARGDRLRRHQHAGWGRAACAAWRRGPRPRSTARRARAARNAAAGLSLRAARTRGVQRRCHGPLSCSLQADNACSSHWAPPGLQLPPRGAVKQGAVKRGPCAVAGLLPVSNPNANVCLIVLPIKKASKKQRQPSSASDLASRCVALHPACHLQQWDHESGRLRHPHRRWWSVLISSASSASGRSSFWPSCGLSRRCRCGETAGGGAGAAAAVPTRGAPLHAPRALRRPLLTADAPSARPCPHRRTAGAPTPAHRR